MRQGLWHATIYCRIFTVQRPYLGDVAFPTTDDDDDLREEEELGDDSPENCVSLAGPPEKKEELRPASRPEILKGTRRQNSGGKSLWREEPGSSTLEDEVEMPVFLDEGDFTKKGNNVLPEVSNTLEDKKSHQNAAHSVGSEKQDGLYPWSAVSEEAEALMFLNETATCYSKAKNFSKGVKGKGKGKPKFSFHFQSHKEGTHCPSTSKAENRVSLNIHEVPERLDTTELGSEGNLIDELLEDIQGEEENQLCIPPAEVEARRWHGHAEQSMAELLDGLQDKTSLLRRNFKTCSKTRGGRVHMVVMKSISPLGNRVVTSEDSPELTGSGSSSDDETSDHTLKLAIPETKRQTMVDRFQEALCATSCNDDEALVAVHKPLRVGLFLKLQQVVQSEKERNVQFLKKLQKRTSLNEPDCMDGKILARYLEAKLIVCDCLFSENPESLAWADCPQEMVNGGIKRTIIFNPKICNDVDLEVGNFIRIHSPWKEVQVGNDRTIILSTYVSQISV
ncbi:hypothetical protein FNV43_RR23506 [Rhamnella rubrinervis]|uniref:Uncharacterized protein n=1 Tax=Rhamnella rubrinervis TaxID=2594499 RepID=A0A8K0DYN2_9ROSA|nr:hypothetical protein FNV43_RR23506 [Rhamnella rubrinervis]